MNLHTFFLLWSVVGFLFADAQRPSASTDCPEWDRVGYTAPRRDWPGSITVERISREARPSRGKLNSLRRSPHGTASYIVREPDMTKPGPWVTIVDVFGNRARPIHLRIRVSDHVSPGVRTRWLNEKLLWLQAWRGRIVSLDAILDIETGRFIYEQDANYNSLIVPCSMKAGAPR